MGHGDGSVGGGLAEKIVGDFDSMRAPSTLAVGVTRRACEPGGAA